jgi:peptide methionine sulfoxide reductase MsrA
MYVGKIAPSNHLLNFRFKKRAPFNDTILRSNDHHMDRGIQYSTLVYWKEEDPDNAEKETLSRIISQKT